mmetsp:Transcript_38085/g.89197  ORF Transcript_38085/g.89197 Transcript_38085/m.89197 type:complete len:263 (-) Transcript_38085:90-878(-)
MVLCTESFHAIGTETMVTTPSKDSSDGSRRVRVLFAHGLESGQLGSKAHYMREHFDMEVPDMAMSAYNPLKRNSPSRAVLALGLGVAGCAVFAPTNIFVGCSLLSVGAVVPLTRWRLRRALKRCAEMHREAVISFKPDVVVGSSWGGAVVLKCLEEGYWNGPTVVLAPACEAAGLWRFMWPAWSPRLPAAVARQCIVVHGTLDDTVPVESSRALAANNDLAHYIEEPSGDHRLNSALLDETPEFPQGKLMAVIHKASRLSES